MDFNSPEWDQLLHTLMAATMLMAALGLGSVLYDRTHATPTALAASDSAPVASDAQDRVFNALVSGLR